jgi:hypothetical protein
MTTTVVQAAAQARPAVTRFWRSAADSLRAKFWTG